MQLLCRLKIAAVQWGWFAPTVSISRHGHFVVNPSLCNYPLCYRDIMTLYIDWLSLISQLLSYRLKSGHWLLQKPYIKQTSPPPATLECCALWLIVINRFTWWSVVRSLIYHTYIILHCSSLQWREMLNFICLCVPHWLCFSYSSRSDVAQKNCPVMKQISFICKEDIHVLSRSQDLLLLVLNTAICWVGNNV